MGDTLEFSLKLTSLPVILEETDGTKINCVLSEFNGEGRDIWFEFVQSKMNISKINDEEKSVKIEIKEGRDMKGFQAKLLSLCLFGPDGNLMKEDRLQKFPTKVMSALFNAAQELNGLTEKAKEEAKND